MAQKHPLWQNDSIYGSRHVEQLQSLNEISRILAAGSPLKQEFSEVLDLLDKELGLNRGTITLLGPDDNEIRIEAAHGLSKKKSRSITYRMGEGVTGKVVETGNLMIIPKVSQEPLFLNRFERWNVTKQDLSFLCVPIVIGNNVIGTISVDKPFDETASLEDDARILSIVANLIAIDLKTRRQAAVEKQLLEDDNMRLRQELAGKDMILNNEPDADGHLIESMPQNPDSSSAIGNGSLKDSINDFERNLIIEALKRSNGNLAAAARDLRTTARIVRYKVEELGIDNKQYSKKGVDL